MIRLVYELRMEDPDSIGGAAGGGRQRLSTLSIGDILELDEFDAEYTIVTSYRRIHELRKLYPRKSVAIEYLIDAVTHARLYNKEVAPGAKMRQRANVYHNLSHMLYSLNLTVVPKELKKLVDYVCAHWT